MPKESNALRLAALAAIAAAALALPAMAAQAQQGSERGPNAGVPAKSHHVRVVHRRLYNTYGWSAGLPRGYYGNPWAPRWERPLPQANWNYSGSNGP